MDGNRFGELGECEESFLKRLKILQVLIIIDTICPGEIFGWASLVSHKKRTATAQCLTPSRVFSISADYINDMADKHPEFGYIIMKRLCDVITQRLNNRTEKMIEKKMKSINSILNFIKIKN